MPAGSKLRDSRALGLRGNIFINGVDTLAISTATMGALGATDESTMAFGDKVIQYLDPSGASRTVALPPEQEGMLYMVVNTADAAEDLIVKEDSGTTTIATVAQNEMALLACDGTTWRGIVGSTALNTSHSAKTAANVGTANTGVTAVEYGDAYRHISVLTVSKIDSHAVGDNAALAGGYLLYTFPAGVIVVDYAYMSMGLTAASPEADDDTPDVGLGTVIASGSVAVLSGTKTFEDIITGQTATDADGTATVKTAIPTDGTPLVIESGGAHTVHFNIADTWADTTGTDLTADIAGTVVLAWSFLA